MADELIPSYLEGDFTTWKAKLTEELQASDIFRDLNYEGSNISILIELLSYLGDFTTYFINKVAKNVYMDTADVYECVHRLGRQIGYEPKGARSARATLTVTVSGFNGGDILKVAPWQEIESTEEDEDGNPITFTTTTTTSVIAASASSFSFDVETRQGVLKEYTDYVGEDLVDNILLLPTGTIFAYDENLEDDYPVIEVKVNGTPWSRVSDFYDEMSGLYDENDVYMFRYDKYGYYIIEFSTARNVPANNDEIEVKVLESLGSGGNVGAGIITGNNNIPSTFVLNYSPPNQGQPVSIISITNTLVAGGGLIAETSTEIKENAKAQIHAQNRNVTKSDYITSLESRSDVIKATAWGEQEIAPSGNILEYNRVYMSVIPDNWGTSTINVSAARWTVTPSISGYIYIPHTYASVYENTLSEFIEPRKMLCAREIYEIPELVNFAMIFGIRMKRGYEFLDAATAIKNKYSYYFEAQNRKFAEIINHLNIIEFILDPSIESATDSFTDIEGIQNFVVREIYSSVNIYESNDMEFYPQYIDDEYAVTVDNKLRRIQLGKKQFPAGSGDLCIVQVEL